jgi:excisionase family DNA binding protein
MRQNKNSKRRKSAMQATQQSENSNSPILNVPETARFMRVSESLVWKMVRSGELKPLRLGDRVLFHRNYLEKFCQQQEV